MNNVCCHEAGGMAGTGRGRAAESGGGVSVTAAARGGTVDQGDESRCYPVEICVLIGFNRSYENK
eukprot:2835803-Prymnesium_polylepis.1